MLCVHVCTCANVCGGQRFMVGYLLLLILFLRQSLTEPGIINVSRFPGQQTPGIFVSVPQSWGDRHILLIWSFT